MAEHHDASLEAGALVELAGDDVGDATEANVPELVVHPLADVEQRLIVQTLLSCRTKDEAARLLGVSTKTLYNKLRRYQAEMRSAGAQKTSAGTPPPQGAAARIA